MHRSTAPGLIILALAATAPPAPGAEALLVDGRKLEGELTAFRFSGSNGGQHEATLHRAEDKSIESLDGRLVRWGNPPGGEVWPQVEYSDGSMLAVSNHWGKNNGLRLTEGTFSSRRGASWVEAPRPSVRSLRFAADGDHGDAGPRRDSDAPESILLRNGDLLLGRLVSIEEATLTLEVFGEPVELAMERVVSIELAPSEAAPSGASICHVGLSDGSLLKATSVLLDGATCQLTTAAGVEFTAAKEEVIFLQPQSVAVRYVSDLEPIDYRHTPYLSLSWPYARDSGLRGQALHVDGRSAVKGIAMHSAARLVYKLDGSPGRFQAEVGVAHAGEGLAEPGSVVFAVYLLKEDRFEEEFQSGVLRGGEASQSVDVDLTDALAIALVVDYADRGDAGDHALWLDARLVSPDTLGDEPR